MATKSKRSTNRRFHAKSEASNRPKAPGVSSSAPTPAQVTKDSSINHSAVSVSKKPAGKLTPAKVSSVSPAVSTTKPAPAAANQALESKPLVQGTKAASSPTVAAPSAQITAAGAKPTVAAKQSVAANADAATKPAPKPLVQGAPRPVIAGQAAGKPVNKPVANAQTVTIMAPPIIEPVVSQPGQNVRVVKESTKPMSRTRKLLLAAVPGFFGLMGLSQLYQGKTFKGLTFFMAGMVASFISSWYIIVPAVLESVVMRSKSLPPYALSFLSSSPVTTALASKLSFDLMGVVVALYGLQLFDAMGPFISKQKAAVITTAVSQKVAVPMPIARRAIVGAPTQTFAAPAQKTPSPKPELNHA